MVLDKIKEEVLLTVETRGSSANLGPGFDSISIALEMIMTTEIKKSEDWEIYYTDEGYSELPKSKENMIVKTILKISEYFEKDIGPFKMKISTKVPLERGVGSSATAISTGIEISDKIGGLNLSEKEKISIGSYLDGGPENIISVIAGGLSISNHSQEDLSVVDYVILPVPDFTVLLMVPKQKLSTSKSRALLPKDIDLYDSVYSSGASNLLVYSLIKEDYNLMSKVIERDNFHVPYRKLILKSFDDIRKIAKKSGAYNTTISGAGSTIAIFVSGEKADKVIRSLEKFSDYEIIKTKPTNNKMRSF